MQDNIWSRVPKGGPIPRRTGRLTVGRKNNSKCADCDTYNFFTHLDICFILLLAQYTSLWNRVERHSIRNGYPWLMTCDRNVFRLYCVLERLGT
jgi:hypothetical protein